MLEFHHGSLFAIELAKGIHITGRVLLDIKRQCIQSKQILDSSPLRFFQNAVLVEIYAPVYEKPTASMGEPLIPGVFTNRHSLEEGVWPTLGHEPVDPEQVEFPENLGAHGSDVRFVRGEVEIPLPLTFMEMRRMRVSATLVGEVVLAQSCLYHLGMRDKMMPPFRDKPEAQSLATRDLRFSEHRAHIYELLGTDPDESYFEFALRHGKDIRRFYETGVPDHAYIGCPYCIRPIEDVKAPCPHCGGDVSKDAPVEISAEAIRDGRRKRCVSCRAVLFGIASTCPQCRTRQS